MKKVCCQLSPFSHAQVRGDPYTNLGRVKKRKPSRENGKRKNQDSP